MFILSLFAIFSGYFFSDLFLGYGSMLFFEVLPDTNFYYIVEVLSQPRKLIPLFGVILSALITILVINHYLGIFSFLFTSDWYLFLFSRIQTFFSKK
jgi:hypothetical protein